MCRVYRSASRFAHTRCSPQHFARVLACLALGAALAGCAERRAPDARREAAPSASAPAAPEPPASTPASPLPPPAAATALVAPLEPARESPAPAEAAKPKLPRKVAKKERVHESLRATGGDGKIHVKRLILAHGIRGREPVGRGQVFALAKTERIYAFVEADNPSEQESNVTVVFEPPSGKTQRVEIPIGAEKRWRTWAFTRSVHEAGTWFATVRDQGGNVLAHAQFKVTP